MRVFPLVLSVLVVLLFSSCLTTNSNHGSTLAAGKGALGVEASYLRQNDFWGQGNESYRANFTYGVIDNFNLGVSAGQYTLGTSTYSSAGGRLLLAIPNDNGSFALGLDLDYYYAFNSGYTEADDFIGWGRFALIQPSISFAYAFSRGAIKPFAGLHATPLLLSAYGGIDVRFGPLKPSLVVGFSRSTLTLLNPTQGGLITLEPGLAFEF